MLAFGNHDELGELLDRGNDKYGASAMSLAAESNNTSAVTALHKLGAWAGRRGAPRRDVANERA
jgi:hypothetical protein